MAEEVTRTRVELDHPYRVVGIILVILSFITLGFTLGALARCGNGNGVCLDYSTHAAGDAGLILFVLFLIVGVALIAYSGSATATSTRTLPRMAPPAAPAPSTTVVMPQAAPAAPAVVTNNVSPPAVVVPATVSAVTPPQ
jgi:hypothetical protein